MGSKADTAQPDPETMKRIYEAQKHGLLGSGLHSLGAMTSAGPIDRASQRRSEARGEFMRRMLFDVPTIRSLDYWDIQINPTTDDVVVFMIVRGEVMHMSEPAVGFPNKEFVSKMALLLP